MKIVSRFLGGLGASVLLLALSSAYASPITYGALTSNDDGSTEVILDSLNRLEWLRWDVLDELTYAQTVQQISAGGLYEGWTIANIEKAQQFVNAFLFGGSNACTTDQPYLTDCAFGIPDGLTALLGNNSEGLGGNIDYTYAWFLSDDGIFEETGYIEYYYYPAQTNASRVAKVNNYRSISNTDQASSSGDAPFISWLLYRPVPEPSTIVLFGVGLVGLGFANRKKA